jgi:hypothetical protein
MGRPGLHDSMQYAICNMQHAAVLAVIMHGLVCIVSEPACNRFEEVDGDGDAVAVAAAAPVAVVDVDVEIEMGAKLGSRWR